MGSLGTVLLSVSVAALVAVGVLLLLRRRIQDRLYPGTGNREWARTASTLTWRQRWAVVRANGKGRAAPPELAAAAAQRGRRTAAMVDRMLTRGTGVRRFWLGMAVFWGLMLVVTTVLALLEPHRWQQWYQVGFALYWLGFIWYLLGPPQRRVRDRLLRSAEANEALLAQRPDVSPR